MLHVQHSALKYVANKVIRPVLTFKQIGSSDFMRFIEISNIEMRKKPLEANKTNFLPNSESRPQILWQVDACHLLEHF